MKFYVIKIERETKKIFRSINSAFEDRMKFKQTIVSLIH